MVLIVLGRLVLVLDILYGLRRQEIVQTTYQAARHPNSIES